MFLTVSASVWVYLLLALSGSQTYACGRDNRELCSTLTGARALSFPGTRKNVSDDCFQGGSNHEGRTVDAQGAAR